MKLKLKYILFFNLLLLLFLFARVGTVSAATLYWVGADGAAVNVATNWKTTDPAGCGGGDASAAPGSADTAVFDADCDNGAAITASWNLLKLQTNSGYIGTITQNATTTLTIDPGASGDALALADGTFTDAGNVSTVIDINDGNFNQTGGTFSNTGASDSFTVEQNFTVSGGTFTNTGNTVTFDGADAADDSTITCTGSLGGTVVFSKAGSGSGADITVALGCSISLGANPTSTLHRQSSSTGLINNGTITIASGTWTINNSVADNTTYSITNNGTINHTGASAAWDINDGGIVNNSGATINYSGTAITIERNFTQSGTFDLSGVTVTFDDTNTSDDSTITCTGTLGGTVVVTKNSDGDFIVASGCSISLGASPTTTIDTTATTPFDNNGTVTIASGTWTVTGTGGGNINNDGTITHSGTGWDINDAGFLNNSDATVTYSGTTMSVERNFTQSGTFDLTGKTITFDGSSSEADDSTITCSGTLGGTVVFSKTVFGDDITIASGCSISLGAGPTSTISYIYSGSVGLTNNGTITVASGTWTVNAGTVSNLYNIVNNGTITHSGTGWDINDGGLVNNAGATITYSGTAITIERNFTQSGTFDLTGKTITFDGSSSGADDSTITCSGTLGGTVVFSKTVFGDDITIASGCSISLGAGPTSTISYIYSGSVGLTNNGTITVASGTWTVNAGTVSNLYNIVNNGTITHSGTGWDINDGSLVNNSGGTITYSGTSITIERSFTQSGTFDLSAVTMTFDDTDTNDDSTVTCTGVLGGTVVVTKNSDGDFIVSSTCNISLGASPTTTIDTTATNPFDNNGTVTITSGTWTVTGTGGGNINNDGTITHTGASPGWDINDAGFLNNSGATTTYTGTTMSVERNFTQNGTFNLSAVTVTLDGADDADDTTLVCGAALGALTINKSHATGNTTLGSSCTVAGAFTRTNGPLPNPASAYTLTVQGDFSMSTTDTFGGANLTLTMGGGNNQTITQNAGTISGPFKVDKSGNVASIASGLNLTTGSTCNIVEGTFNINGRTFTCGSTFTVEDGGTLQRFGTSGESVSSFIANSGSTVIYIGDGDSAADTVTITTPTATYHHLTINSTDGATDTFQLGAALDVNGLLTLTAGTFSVGAGNYGISVGGGWTDTGAGTFTEGSGTVTFDGSGTINSNEAFNNVVVNGSGITATVSTNSLQVGGTLQATLGILDMNGIGATITGLTTVNGGTLQASTATQTYNGALTVSSGTFTGSSGTVDVNGVLTLSGGAFTAPSSAGNLAISGDFTISGTPTFTHNSGTVTFDSASVSQTFTTNGVTLNNFTMNLTSSNGANDNLIISGALDIDGALTITDGELKLDTNNPNVNLAGNLSVASAGTITKGTGTWTFDGSGTSTVDDNGQDLGAVALGTSGKTIQLSGSNFAATTFALSNGTFNGNGQTATFGGLATVSGGTYTAGSATQTFNAGLTVNGGTFTGGSGTVDVNNTLTISSGAFTAPNSSGSLLLSGNLAISGSPTFTHNSGTFTFDAGSGTQTVNGGGVSFNNISHSGAGTLQTITNPITIGGTFTNSLGTYDANSLATTVTGLATVSGGIYTAGTATQKFDGGLTVSGGTFTGSSGAVDVNGALMVSSGVFTAPSSSGTFTVSGNFDHSGGTFTHNSGTITLDGGSQSILGSSTFNNLTKNVASAATLTFGNGTTQTFAGAMNLKGAASNLLSLRSSSAGTQWRIDPQGTRSIQYLDLKDSYNINATGITTADLNITDSGNNTGWTFNTAPSAPSSLGSSSFTNGSWTTDNTPTFTFTLSDPDASQTVLFRIQIDNNSDFSSVVVDYSSALQAQGSTSFTVGQSAGSGSYTTGSSGQTLSDSGGYYWRVRTEDAIGTTSDYTTANSGGIAFKVDATDPSAVSLISPDDKSYITEERPTFRFKLASTPDATSGIDKYTLTVDNGDTDDFTIDDIPASRTSDYSTNKFLIKYEGFSDSDSTNNYISVYTKHSSSWGSNENDGKLKEGKRTWTVTAYDNAGNSKSGSYTLYADFTSPSLSSITLPDMVDTIDSYHLMSTTLPHIKSSLSDNLFPYQVEISFIKENFLLGFKISETTFLTEKTTVNTTATTDNISFNLQPSGSLDYGKYIVKVKAYDKAGNQSSEQEFLIHLLTNEKLQALLFLKNRDKDKKITDKEKEQDTTSFPYLEKQAKIRKAKEAEELNEFIAEIKKLFTSVRFLSFGFEIVKGGLLAVSLPQVENYKYATQSLAQLLKEEGMIEDKLAYGISFVDKTTEDIIHNFTASFHNSQLFISYQLSQFGQTFVVNPTKLFVVRPVNDAWRLTLAGNRFSRQAQNFLIDQIARQTEQQIKRTDFILRSANRINQNLAAGLKTTAGAIAAVIPQTVKTQSEIFISQPIRLFVVKPIVNSLAMTETTTVSIADDIRTITPYVTSTILTANEIFIVQPVKLYAIKPARDIVQFLIRANQTTLQAQNFLIGQIAEQTNFQIIRTAEFTLSALQQTETVLIAGIRQTEAIFDRSMNLAAELNRDIERTINNLQQAPIAFLGRGANGVKIALATFYTYTFDPSKTAISDIAIDKIGQDYAVISWSTNHYTINNKVNYGKTVSYGEEAWGENYTKEHKVKITGLKSNTHYVFEVMSQGKNYVYDAYYGVTTKK